MTDRLLDAKVMRGYGEQMKETIVKSDRYRRQYVALSDFRRRTVVAHGPDPRKVHAAALKKGYPEPVIVYVPPKDTVQIYARAHPAG